MNEKTVKILALGDVVGPHSVSRLCSVLGSLKRELGADLTVVNGENAAQGNGLDIMTARTLFSGGADVITSGNHIWQKREMEERIEEEEFILRPLNYPKGTPGRGSVVFERFGVRILVMNVLGIVMMDPLRSPFDAIEEELERHKGEYDLSVLDIHAETTSEKRAIAEYFDGKINVIFGTHTHVLTADNKILPKGSGFITDIGMCGPVDSVLGVKKECVIRKLRTGMPTKFENPEGEVEINGAVFTCSLTDKKVLSAELLRKTV